MRRANKKDATHAPIVAGLRQRGIVVYDMPDPGDVLCWYQGVWMPMEIKKDARAPLTKSQQTRATDRRMFVKRPDGSQGWIDVTAAPIPLVATLAEGLALFGLTE